MPYTPSPWANGSAGGTPLSAARLNSEAAAVAAAIAATDATVAANNTAQAVYATSRAVALALVLGGT